MSSIGTAGGPIASTSGASTMSGSSSDRRPSSDRPSGSGSGGAAAAAPNPAATFPTIFVTYGEKSVKARIDREVPLAEIIRQLVGSVQLGLASEPAVLFALREKDTSVLVTDENMGKLLDRGQAFVLTSSPTIEAAEIVEKLNSGDPSVLKLATFSLRTLIKERAFLTEFLDRGGLNALQDVIQASKGNTLSYSLLSMQNLMDLEERGWEGLEKSFVKRIVEIIATEPLINIARPATAILRRLSLSAPPSSSASFDPQATPNPAFPSGSGFPAVYEEIIKQPQFMSIVVERMSSGDVPIATLSLALVNSLFRGSTDLGDTRFGDDLERLDAWSTVAKLLETERATGDLFPILTFQSNLIASLHLVQNTPITEAHYGLFDDIWIASGLEDTPEDEGFRWMKLGFETESPQLEFEGEGLLGLKALASWAVRDKEEFAQTVSEQLSRPEDRRCPIATLSTTILSLLSDHFDISQGVSQTPTSPQPFLLRFYECHHVACLFFLRIWQESGAKIGDFERVATLTKSQIAASLSAAYGEKTWEQVKQELLHVEYKVVRDRQMRELEIEDDILSKAPVRNLRHRLYRESFEFVRGQRISSLHEGAWFLCPRTAPTGGKKNAAAPAQMWRFYRLAANKKVLHYVEASARRPIRGGLDDLPERIDLALVTEVATAGSASLSTDRGRSFSVASLSAPVSRQNANNVITTNPLSFSLLSADGVLAELIAPNQATYSEWVDGLALLRPDGNISTKETADFVHILTEIGVKIKLLDLSGEKVDIPATMAVEAVPKSTQFYYAEGV